MRKLMWFTLGFGAACVWGGYFGNQYWLIGAAVLLVLAVVLGIISRGSKSLLAGMLLCIGCVAGLCWFLGYDALYLSAPEELDGKTVVVTIRASNFSRETNYGYAVDGTILLDGREYRLVAYLDGGEEPLSLLPGDQVTGEFRFRLTTDSGAEESTYHQGKGVFLLAYQTGTITVIPSEVEALRDLPATLHWQILSLIEDIFPADTGAFAKALLLGDDSDLDYETDAAFKISGIRHVVAVSGLHVSILFSVVYQISGKRRLLTALLGIPAVLLFAAVTGFNPSITRACVMQVLMMLALLFEREYDPPTALCFAALVMLAINPLVITSVSFQLSVGCMAGIFLFSGRIRNWLLSEKCMGRVRGKRLSARLKRWFAGSVSMTLGATVITTPLSAVYFGTVSLIGVVTNLLTLWIITYIFCGIMIACILGAIWLPLGVGLAGIIAWGIRFVLWISRLLASVPLAAVYTKSEYIVIWLVMCYVLLAVFLSTRKKPVLLFSSCVVLGLCVSLMTAWTDPLMDECRMTVLDVGQGQCILLQSEGQSYLVDCGGSRGDLAADEAAETLLSQGISHLDGLILTHYDADHAGGAANLLTRVDANMIFLPDTKDEAQVGAAVAEKTGGEAYMVSETMKLCCGDAELTIFPPLRVDSGNESSLCVLFQTTNCAILITGDRSGFGERMLLRQHEIPDVDVLIVGHHGAKDSACNELLEAVFPEVAIISVGENNRYGHPAQAVLNRLSEHGCRVYRTDLHGTIIFRR